MSLDDGAPARSPRSPRPSRQPRPEPVSVPITPVESQALSQEFVTNQTFIRDELRRLLQVFYWFNGTVLGFVFIVWLGDSLDRWLGAATHDRIVTSSVLMSLIGASAAQLGALAFAVGSKVLRLQDTLLALIGAPTGRNVQPSPGQPSPGVDSGANTSK